MIRVAIEERTNLPSWTGNKCRHFMGDSFTLHHNAATLCSTGL